MGPRDAAFLSFHQSQDLGGKSQLRSSAQSGPKQKDVPPPPPPPPDPRVSLQRSVLEISFDVDVGYEAAVFALFYSQITNCTVIRDIFKDGQKYSSVSRAREPVSERVSEVSSAEQANK